MRTLAVALTFLGTVATAVAEPAPDHAATLERLRNRIATLQEELKARKRELGRATRALDLEQRALERQAQVLAEIEARMRERYSRLQDLEAERDRHLASMTEQKAALAAMLRAVHAQGERDWLRVLLDEEDPGRAGRLFVYQQYAARARAEHIDTVVAYLERVIELGAQVQGQATELAADEATARARLAAIEAKRAAQARRVARLSAGVDERDSQLQRLRADATELANLLEELARLEADAPGAAGLAAPATPFEQLRGRLPWPVQGRVSRRYGAALGGDYTSEGVLLDSAQGAAVSAISAGRVVFADQFGQLGLLVIVDHGDGYMSLYGQTSAVSRNAGDWVAAGDVIATAGAISDQDRGIYFEIRKDGHPIDPAEWCRAP